MAMLIMRILQGDGGGGYTAHTLTLRQTQPNANLKQMNVWQLFRNGVGLVEIFVRGKTISLLLTSTVSNCNKSYSVRLFFSQMG